MDARAPHPLHGTIPPPADTPPTTVSNATQAACEKAPFRTGCKEAVVADTIPVSTHPVAVNVGDLRLTASRESPAAAGHRSRRESEHGSALAPDRTDTGLPTDVARR